MNLHCDYSEYISIFNEVIEELQYRDLDKEDFSKVLVKTCELLRMLRVAHMVNASESIPLTGASREPLVVEGVVLTSDNVDYSRLVEVSRNKDNMSKFVSKAYQYEGDADWTEDERKCIEAVIIVMYVFVANTRLGKRAYMSFFMDMEMGIPNIKSIEKDTAQLFESGEAAKYSSVRFNISKLGVINLLLGRPRANIMLRRYLYQLQGMLGDNGTVYRIGGDNFYAIFKTELFEMVKQALIETEMKTEWPDVPSVLFETRAGYYYGWNPSSTPNEVMDITHKIGAAAHINKYESYKVTDNEYFVKAKYAKEVEDGFARAIKNEEFVVYYQAKFNSATNTVIGAEALCRWKRNGEIIPPAAFIPVLERSNKICQLDFYILRQVCRNMKAWIEAGRDPVRISINFSRIHLWNRNLADWIENVIDEYNIPHQYIEIELTETTTDVNYEMLRSVVNSLHEKGIHTAVDDFGIGYSSLNLVRDLPWDVLKIDRSFLPVENDPDMIKKKAVLKHMIQMTQELGVSCLAEGAETLEQVLMLKEFGCLLVQGFYYSKPVSKEEFDAEYERQYLS